MSQTVAIKLEVPDDLVQFRLPTGVNARLQGLLDRQDRGLRLTAAERKEAEGLVNLTEMLTLLRMRAERVAGRRTGRKFGGRGRTSLV
jgi:hypothetical protein